VKNMLLREWEICREKETEINNIKAKGEKIMEKRTVRDAVKEIVKTAEFARNLPHTPAIIKDHPLNHSDRRNGGHGKFFGVRYWTITNIRMADGSAKNPYAALLTYQDGDLVCDLIEDDPNIPDPDNVKKLVAMAYYDGLFCLKLE